MALIDSLSRAHARLVMSRRVEALAGNIAELIDRPGKLLDVGCGDGTVAALICQKVAGLTADGIDVMARPSCVIPMKVYDGAVFPCAAQSYDYVLFTDVLHHTPDPLILLREAQRVARRAILVKDHLRESAWDDLILRFMDWVGNRPHGVVLPYNYWSERQWRYAWSRLGLEPAAYLIDLGLYPAPFRPLFQNGLHFLVRLVPAGPREQTDHD